MGIIIPNKQGDAPVIHIPMLDCGFFAVNVMEIALIEKTGSEVYRMTLKSGVYRDLVLDEIKPVIDFFQLSSLESIEESLSRAKSEREGSSQPS